MKLRKWEVYRQAPHLWMAAGINPFMTDEPYSRHWTRKGAEKMAQECDRGLRNGRSDDEFAAFKARKRT